MKRILTPIRITTIGLPLTVKFVTEYLVACFDNEQDRVDALLAERDGAREAKLVDAIPPCFTADPLQREAAARQSSSRWAFMSTANWLRV